MPKHVIDHTSLYPSIRKTRLDDHDDSDDDAVPEHPDRDGNPPSIARPRLNADNDAPVRKCPGCKHDYHAWMGFQSGCEKCGPICVRCLMAARLVPSHFTSCPGCGCPLDSPAGLINQQQLLQQQRTNMVGYLSEGVTN
jgi:hypothetical protein